jgi:hypothetical protein
MSMASYDSAAVVNISVNDVEKNEQTDPQFDRDGYCHGFKEIRNLVWVTNDPLLKAALGEWNRKEQILSARLESKEKRGDFLLNEIYQLMGFFSVFQGVLLTAVSQMTPSTKSECGKVWAPILLSAFAGAFTVIGLFLRFRILQSLKYDYILEKRSLAEVSFRRKRLLEMGREFRFFKHESRKLTVPKFKSFEGSKIFLLASTIVLTGFFIVSHFAVLCDMWEIKSFRSGL